MAFISSKITTMKPSVFVISITPFDAEGRLDEPGLRAHLDRMADAGVGVYLGGGGSGEGFTLTDDEARRVLEIGVDQIGGRVPVRAMGIEPRTAQQMIDYIGVAAEAGVDAAQIYSLDPGHGHRPTPAEIEAYLRAVLESTSLPCVVSSHQSVGYAVRPALLATLADEHPHLVGVNCSHGDIGQLVALSDAVGGRLELHVGGPMQALSCLALGGQGYLTSEANLAPRLCASVIERYTAGDLDATFSPSPRSCGSRACSTGVVASGPPRPCSTGSASPAARSVRRSSPSPTRWSTRSSPTSTPPASPPSRAGSPRHPARSWRGSGTPARNEPRGRSCSGWLVWRASGGP